MESSISSSLSLESVHADSLIWTNKIIEAEPTDNQTSSNLIGLNKNNSNPTKYKSRPP